MGLSLYLSFFKAFLSMAPTNANSECLAVSNAMISPLYKSMTGERYSFSPRTLNSVTSVTHF
ncbi:hypothetical protein D3C72_2110590 [compost metagenome]